MDLNIIGHFPRTEPTLFSEPRNIAEGSPSGVWECSEDFSDLSLLGSSWPRQNVTQC
jgi:hypothetical protein